MGLPVRVVGCCGEYSGSVDTSDGASDDVYFAISLIVGLFLNFGDAFA